jgi:hypothetical protein
MALKAYKTARGEVYEKCGIEFSETPTALTEATLNEKRGELGLTIGERLNRDGRLVECEAPKDAKPVTPKPASPEPVAADETGNSAGGKGRKGAGDK